MDKNQKIILYTSGIFLFFIVFFHLVLSAPFDFLSGAIIKIEPGSSLRNVSLQLKEMHIIRSRLAFEAFVIIFNREKHLVSTDYYFENNLPVYEVARRISKGERHLAPISVTIPEGFDNIQIANTFASKLPNFDKGEFLKEAKGLEGYLFPDTYFFFTPDTDKDVLRSMSENFEKKIAPFRSDINMNGKTENQVISLASLIEREAKGQEDREIISGILWKRIGVDMPLQVDAVPETYKIKGLPKNPICNPGLDAIKAAIFAPSAHPLPPYLYYLHDKAGNIHYAKTFAEHRQNVLKYLK